MAAPFPSCVTFLFFVNESMISKVLKFVTQISCQFYNKTDVYYGKGTWRRN